MSKFVGICEYYVISLKKKKKSVDFCFKLIYYVSCY